VFTIGGKKKEEEAENCDCICSIHRIRYQKEGRKEGKKSERERKAKLYDC
jgi:hypothetical protein